MDIDSLKSLYKQDHTARQFFRWLYEQAHSFRVLGVSAAEEQTGIDYYDLVALFKHLDMKGIGDFIVGRKGHDSRIVWHFNTNSIAKAAIGEINNILALLATDQGVPRDAIDLLETSVDELKENSMKHSFNLRKDFVVEIELPQDFDGTDLTRMKNWLELLVF